MDHCISYQSPIMNYGGSTVSQTTSIGRLPANQQTESRRQEKSEQQNVCQPQQCQQQQQLSNKQQDCRCQSFQGENETELPVQEHHHEDPNVTQSVCPPLVTQAALISHRDISLNNSRKGHKSWWFPYRGKVYDVRNILEALKDVLEERRKAGADRENYSFSDSDSDVEPESDEGEGTLDLISNINYLPMLEVMNSLERMKLFNPPSCGEGEENGEVETSSVDKAIAMCCIGDLEIPTRTEMLNHFRDDLLEVDDVYRQDSEALDPSIHILIQRHLQRLHTQFSPLPEGNPNEMTFPLSSGVDQSTLREGLGELPPLDFEIDGESAWKTTEVPDKIDVSDADEIFRSLVMSGRSSEPFDVEITGDYAWKSFDDDLFKNDETTQEQERVWQAREGRTDLGDEQRMARRRKGIANYFGKKYEWSSVKLEPYSAWAENMKKSRQQFEELCG